MFFLTKVVVIGALVLGGFSAYARLAPSDPARWHALPENLEAGDGSGSAVRVIEDEEGTLPRLDDIIRTAPRTSVLAGSPEEGMITYVTRSFVFGFPDYTTVARKDGNIILFGRLRFGASDMGVNAKRLNGWLNAL